jgi:hypothetical protein
MRRYHAKWRFGSLVWNSTITAAVEKFRLGWYPEIMWDICKSTLLLLEKLSRLADYQLWMFCIKSRVSRYRMKTVTVRAR